MLRPRWRKVLHDLWDNKIRTLLVVASIAVGVFAIGVIVGTYVLLSQDLSTSYAAVNPANIDVITDPFDPNFVDAIRRMEGVAHAEGRRTARARIRLGPDEWDVLSLVAVPDFSEMQINQLLPQDGAAVPPDNEVILERKTQAELGVAAGDTLEIELADGTIRHIRVAGSAQEPTVGYGGILGDLKGFVTYDTLEWLHYPLSLNQLYVTVAESPNDRTHIQYIADRVTDRLEKSGRQVYRTELSRRNKHPLSSIIQALLGVLSILGVLVVFLSGSLITNTMSALLNQHLRQIGVMKLVGARQPQIVGMYLALIEAFGLIALTIAIPLGGWGAFALSSYAADVINFVLRDPPSLPLVPIAVVLQVIIAILTPLGAGMLPVIKGSRTTVQKALSSTGLGGQQTEKGWLDRALERIRLLSRPLMISVRNTFRRKGRLALTLFTLTLGGAIFIAVFNTRMALNLKVNESVKYFLADVNLDFARPYRIERIVREAMTIPGVENVEVWVSTSAKIVHDDGTVSDTASLADPSKNALRKDGAASDTVSIIAPPADSELVDPTLLHGRWLLQEDENAIAVNEAFWTDYPDLKPGDRIRLEISERKDDWTVVGIYQYTGVEQLIAYTNYDYLARELDQPYHASVYRIVTSEHSLEFQKQVSAQLERHFKDLGLRISKIESGRDFAGSITDVLGILIVILLAMALLTALVGSIGLTGTMSMNVLERTREIGVMRAIGAYNQIVSKLVIVEGLIIGVISYLAGVVFSFPITYLLSNVISLAIFNSPAQFAFTAQGPVIWFVLVSALSVGASLLPARNATKLTIREVLAYE
jgi:putative ABC transport system permease protein